MTAYLLRRVKPGFAEIIIAANGRADAYELTEEQVKAIGAQATEMAGMARVGSLLKIVYRL